MRVQRIDDELRSLVFPESLIDVDIVYAAYFQKRNDVPVEEVLGELNVSRVGNEQDVQFGLLRLRIADDGFCIAQVLLHTCRITVRSVSYTQLDVYKRQVWS